MQEEKNVMMEQETPVSGMTRRTFMKGIAAGVAAVSLASILPSNVEAEAAKKPSWPSWKPEKKKNGIYIDGGDVNMDGQTYTLEFVQPVKLVAYIDGEEQTEGTWRSENKHLVSVDPDGTIVMRDGVGGYDVDITWTLGKTVYTVTFHTSQTIGAACITADRPMTRGDFMIKLAKYFGWYHYNGTMDDGTDIDEAGELMTTERVRNYYDVTGRADYVKAIECALDQGVLKAESPDECFYPMSTMTREDAAVIICNAFHIDPLDTDYIKYFDDARKVSKSCYQALNALVGLNYMRGTTDTKLGPTDGISFTEANICIDNIDRQVVCPVWSMPTSHRKFVRVRPIWKTATEGATVHWRTRAFNISHKEMEGLFVQDRGVGVYLKDEWGDWYDYTPGYSTDPCFGLNNNKDLPYDRIYFCVEVECYATKPGMKDSPHTKFVWRIDRPAWHDFAFDVLHEGDENFPTIYRFFDNFQAAAYYIQGSKFGILFDGLMPTNTSISLADWINGKYEGHKKLATTEWAFVLGHEHGDHNGAMPYCYEAGQDVYVCKKVGSKGKNYTITTYDRDYTSANSDAKSVTAQGTYGDRCHEIDEGYVFDLGNAKFKVYRLPGHEDASMILHDAEHGLIFSSDIYGVNRYWVADQFSAKGVKQDLLMSLQQQLMVEYQKNGGQIKEVYTGHNRIGVGSEYLMVWEQCLQKIIDFGEDAVSDDRRGDGAILAKEGDSFETLNWTGFGETGKQKYVTYTGQYDGKEFNRIEFDNTNEKTAIDTNFYWPHNQNCALSNIVFKNATLVGHDFLFKAGQASMEDKMEDGSYKYVVENKFFPIDTKYDVKVRKTQSKVTFTPVTMSNRATMTVNGKPASTRCPITVRTNAPVKIVVTAPDGESKMTYKFTFKKK